MEIQMLLLGLGPLIAVAGWLLAEADYRPLAKTAVASNLPSKGWRKFEDARYHTRLATTLIGLATLVACIDFLW